MKSLHRNWMIAFNTCIIVVLAGLGIVISQLFPVLSGNSSPTSLRIGTEKIGIVFYVVSLLIVLLVIFLFIVNRFARNYFDHLDHISSTAIELAKGNYRARVFELPNSATESLSKSMNVLARNLQEISDRRLLEKERLNTLIETMDSALLMIDRDGRISIMNKHFQQLFRVHSGKSPKYLQELHLPKEILSFIELVFLTENSKRQQMTIQYSGLQNRIDVFGSPVIGEHGRWLGIVIVAHDITELMKLEQIRKDFVANVSHELRTPITAIKGFSETLLDGAYQDEKALLNFLEIIFKESNRLQLLINDLLELSKAEQQDFNLTKVNVNLKEIILEAVEILSPRVEEKNCSIVYLSNEDVFLSADRYRLMQVVVNLLSNAVTYSQDGTTIKIAIENREKEVLFSIEDEGIGIASEELNRIFERFYRVDRARSRNSGGTGLGLAIVKHLIEAHKGTIQVESEPGIGTKFTVFLPK
ncbi:two-component system histidine kinase PnpS [Paenisporosarcina cavernae]|uniref:histidine kinase n=1 Tax=Paenisporosarcina cavernae TaxID=2320858 RepID=A0A385YT21_9BACL|nr:ATP-binding protein [Paenisporosarcina cavernae]AYC29826.1 PAS domain-containing protein [Paenisporosarcina cavernae]